MRTNMRTICALISALIGIFFYIIDSFILKKCVKKFLNFDARGTGRRVARTATVVFVVFVVGPSSGKVARTVTG